MGKRATNSFRESANSQYSNIRDALQGYSYARTIMPPKATSHGGGITAIFRHVKSGQEKPIPYETLNKMEKSVKCALRNSNRLKKRDRDASNCDDPVLSKIMTARQAADRARHSVRSIVHA